MAPTLPTQISVKVAGANAGEYVIVRNLTNGEQVTDKLAGSDKATVLTPTSTWSKGDKIQAEIRGARNGVEQITFQGGNAQISITATADTSTPGVSL